MATTKETILALLEASRGRYLSGEEIGRTCALSRAAVWKAMKALQNEGYAIDAVKNKGYRLSEETDILSAQGIRKYLRTELAQNDLTVLPITTSTNTVVREMANAGAKEGCAVFALEQTAGRGRMGRSFYSPQGSGVYMSFLLRPGQVAAEQAVRITTMAAVALCEAIEECAEETATIKWVNDVFVRGKKVCGILTEGSFDLENGMLDYAVLGVGVNVYAPPEGFPEELASIAGSVFSAPYSDAKNRLAATFWNHFYAYYTAERPDAYVEAYRRRSFVIGKRVQLLSGQEITPAQVLDIDDQCRLLVRYDDGRTACYSSGEIRVKFDQTL